DYRSPCFPGLACAESLSHEMWYGGFTLASSRLQDRITWLAGAGYTWLHYNGMQDGLGNTAITNEANRPQSVGPGREIEALLGNTTRQLELHGMLNARVTEQFEASVGARIERASFDFAWRLNVPPSQESPHSYGDSTVVAPRLSLTFQPNYRNLAYATVAKGYRSGGPNNPASCNCTETAPVTYGPDSVWNFELGSRSTSFEGRLQIDLSLFHMVWYDIQAP